MFFAHLRTCACGLWALSTFLLPASAFCQARKTVVMPPSAYAQRQVAANQARVALHTPAMDVFSLEYSEGGVAMEFDSLTQTWTPLDSARIAELAREQQEAAKKRHRDWLLRTFGPDWPNIEAPLRMGPHLHADRAYAFADAGRTDSAEKVLRRALFTEPRNADLSACLGDVYALRMRTDTTLARVKRWFRKAEAAYLSALRANHRSHRINHNLGLLYSAYFAQVYWIGPEQKTHGVLKRTDWDIWWKARQPLERAYRLSKDHPDTTALLDRWYESHGISGENKEQMFRRAQRRAK